MQIGWSIGLDALFQGHHQPNERWLDFLRTTRLADAAVYPFVSPATACPFAIEGKEQCIPLHS